MLQSKLPNIPGRTLDEQENYIKVIDLTHLIENVFRRLFHKYYPSKSKDLYSKLKDEKEKIDSLSINDYQYNLLLPQQGNSVNSLIFDASLLAILLLKLCKCDDSEQNFIHSCRDIRNRAHHLAKGTPVTRENMNDIFNTMKKLLIKRNNAMKTKESQRILNELIKLWDTKFFERNVEPLQYRYITPVASFFNRDEEIQRLHHLMKNSLDVQSYLNKENKLGVVIYGMGGVGKSQLSRQYAKNYIGIFYSSIIFINGESKEAMINDFQNIGERSNLEKINNSDGTFKDLSEVVIRVYEHFSIRKPSSPIKKVLFIFDNVEEQESLEEFLPPLNKEPYILVTSQCREWDERFDVLPLNVFSEKNAVQFIKKKDLVIKPSEDDCSNISNLVGYHPLALQQVLLFLSKNNMSFSEYTEQFQISKQKILSIPTKDIGNKFNIFEVISSSIEKITQSGNDEISVNVLYIMSLLDGKKIQKGLLRRFCVDPSVLRGKLILLHKYSIIEDVETHHQDYWNQTITIHSLTQYVLQDLQQKADRLVKTIESIGKILKEDTNNMTKELFKNRWHNHFLPIMENLSKQYPCYISIKLNIASWLIEACKYNKALEIYEEIETMQKGAFGEHNHDYLATKRKIALCYTNNGQHDEASKIYKEIERIDEEIEMKIFCGQNPDYVCI